MRAAAALPAFLPVGRHLFDGGFASTLPGAAWAPVWVPVAGWLGVAAAIALGARLGPRLRVALLVALALVAEAVNRNVLRTEYPAVHTFLTVVAAAAAGLALRFGVAPRARRAAIALGAAAFAATLALGLGDPASRLVVATRGTHARLLTNVARDLVDLDGDGHAAVLGGPDCDDLDPGVHPDAIDDPGDAVDEDCDGIAAVAPAPPPPPPPSATAWREDPEVRAVLERGRAHNVVLVLVDTLRGDVVPRAGGEDARELPHLAKFLAEARDFRHAFAPSAGTDVSVSSLLTGRVNPFERIDKTLPERQRDAGRATHAVFPAEVLRWAGETLLRRGFDAHDRVVADRVRRDVADRATSAETTDLGLRFLDRRPTDRPFFLWLHYFDVHEHAELPEDADPRDGAGRPGAETAAARKRRRYRAQVRRVDAELGRLDAALRERGLYDSTIVVLAADHGESLGEDPRLPDHHGLYVYNPLVHVPLAIRVPGVPPATIDAPVSLIDLYPTLGALTGAGGAGDGLDLLPLLLPGAPPDAWPADRALPLNESDQFGVVVWPDKLLVRRAENVTELYDLSTDFAERRNRAAAEPERVRALLARYRAFPPLRVDRTARARRQRDEAARTP